MSSSLNPSRDRALAHLDASLAARDSLADLYGSQGARADRAVVAELHEAVRMGVKLAQVHALLAIEARLATFSTDVLAEVGLDRITSRAAS